MFFLRQPGGHHTLVGALCACNLILPLRGAVQSGFRQKGLQIGAMQRVVTAMFVRIDVKGKEQVQRNLSKAYASFGCQGLRALSVEMIDVSLSLGGGLGGRSEGENSQIVTDSAHGSTV